MPVVVLVLCVFLHSCDIINPEEEIPAQIDMKNLTLAVTPGQGTNKHKITEVWVSNSLGLVGAFTPPAKITYHTEEPTTNFTFRAGIRNNGILNDAIVYPMLSPITMEFPTSPGSSTPFEPVFFYKPEAKFSFLDDFEGINQFNDHRDTFPGTTIELTSEGAFEGQKSGLITLTKENNLIDISHTNAMIDLPTDGKAAYLEFHYKSEMFLSIGIEGIPLNGQTFTNYFYVLNPSEEWNKIYIELTQLLEDSALPSYKIRFRSFYPPEATVPELRIWLDNIKVVHL